MVVELVNEAQNIIEYKLALRSNNVITWFSCGGWWLGVQKRKTSFSHSKHFEKCTEESFRLSGHVPSGLPSHRGIGAAANYDDKCTNRQQFTEIVPIKHTDVITLQPHKLLYYFGFYFGLLSATNIDGRYSSC